MELSTSLSPSATRGAGTLHEEQTFEGRAPPWTAWFATSVNAATIVSTPTSSKQKRTATGHKFGSCLHKRLKEK